MVDFLISILIAIAVVFLVPPTPAPGADSTAGTPHFPMCSPATPEGTGCWISLTIPQDCDFRVGYYRPGGWFDVTSVSFWWSGECRDSAAHGPGTLSAEWLESVNDLGTFTGEFEGGVMQGHWFFDFDYGSSEEGLYEDGLRQGHWVLRHFGTVWEGQYVDDLEHGTWGRLVDGEVSYHEYRYGEKIE